MTLDDVFDLLFSGDLLDCLRADDTGVLGEDLTEKRLHRLQKKGMDGYVLRNLYLPAAEGETSEIDLLFITQKAVFVIESKNYSGWIYGDEDDYKWVQVLPGGKKNKFYNPIRQNKTHIAWLEQQTARILPGVEIPLISLIVFSQRCELKKVTVRTTRRLAVIKRDELMHELKDFYKHTPDSLTAEQTAALADGLRACTEVSTEVKAAHIEKIEQKFGKNELPAKSEPETPAAEICPRCGSVLVLRTAKKGSNAGNTFYGCSAFPKCRFTKTS